MKFEEGEFIPLAPDDSSEPEDLYEGPAYEGDVHPADTGSSDSAEPDRNEGDLSEGELYEEPKRENAPPLPLLAPLTYPLRGSTLWALIPLSILRLFSGLGCLSLVVAPIMAGFLFEIIRQTQQGRDRLQGYPDLHQMGPRCIEAIATYAVGAIPMTVASGAMALLSPAFSAGGWLAVALLAPFVLAVNLLCYMAWFLMLGATAAYDDWMIWIHVDRHARAFVTCWKSVWVFMLRVSILVGIALLFFFVSLLFSSQGLGVLLLLASIVYVFLASGHFVGLLFRENANELESIYLLK